MASRCLEDSSSTLYDIAYVLDGQLDDIVFDKTCIALYNATDGDAMVQRGSSDGPYSSIHARGIAAACQHTDGFDIVVHSSYFPFPFLSVTNYKHLLHEIQLLFVK